MEKMNDVPVTILGKIFGAVGLSIAATSGVLSDANAVERLTVSALLAVAVIVLYRELAEARKNAAEMALDNKNFIAAQTLATQQASQMHAEALGKLANALNDQQRALALQVQTYEKYIQSVVEKATRKHS